MILQLFLLQGHWKLWNICVLLNKDNHGAASSTDVILKGGERVWLVNKN